MQRLQLRCIEFSSFSHISQQLMDSFILFLEPFMEVNFVPFKFLFGILLHSFQFLNIILGIIHLLFQCINNFLITILHGFAILCMEHYQSVLQVIQFNISILFYCVNLFLQYVNFLQQFFSVFLMLSSHPINLTK